jgi:hypothetical protein
MLIDAFLTNYIFDGAQANIIKELSGNFHVQHQFSLGSQVAPPMYNFMAGYTTERVSDFYLLFDERQPGGEIMANDQI